MPIVVSCKCGKKFKVKDELAGRAVKCPACSSPLKIPGAAPAKTGASASGDGGEAAKSAALLKFEEAQKRKAMTAEEEAAYRAEQNKLIESYEQLAGKAEVKKGDKPEKKHKLGEGPVKKRTIIDKITDSFAAMFGTLAVKYLMIAVLFGAGVVGSVFLVKYMTTFVGDQTKGQVPREQRVKDLMKEAKTAVDRKDWARAKTDLDEIDQLDPKKKEMNRDYQAMRKAVDAVQ